MTGYKSASTRDVVSRGGRSLVVGRRRSGERVARARQEDTRRDGGAEHDDRSDDRRGTEPVDERLTGALDQGGTLVAADLLTDGERARQAAVGDVGRLLGQPHDGGGHPADVLRGDDRAQHRDAEGAAEFAGGVVHRRADAGRASGTDDMISDVMRASSRSPCPRRAGIIAR